MKKITAVFFLGLFALISCSQGDGNEFFEMKIPLEKSFILPVSTYSCKGRVESVDPDLSGPTFFIPDPVFVWKHAYNTFIMVDIKLHFDNPNFSGGKYECHINNKELFYLETAFTDTGNPVFEPAERENYNARTEKEMACDIVCGGVGSKEVSFSAGGYIEIIGYMFDRYRTPKEYFPFRYRRPYVIEGQF